MATPTVRVATTTELLAPGRHDLGEGAIIDYRPQALPDPEGVWLQTLRAELPWARHRIRIFGREQETPRFCAYHGDPAASYRYSGLQLMPAPWTPAPFELRAQLERLLGLRFDAVLANRYDDGRHAMGWHSDDEPELGPEPTIASLSFGSPRRFLLRHRRDRRRVRLELHLGGGDLLVMSGRSQSDWQHQLPATARPVGARINLTFRRLGRTL